MPNSQVFIVKLATVVAIIIISCSKPEADLNECETLETKKMKIN